jgi:hypothetical protein
VVCLSTRTCADDVYQLFQPRLENIPCIIGCGRLTGKVGKWTVGALDIQADEQPLADVRQTNFGVLRLRRDVGQRSTIGAMVTSRPVAQSGTGSNAMYGVDSSFSLFQNLYIAGYAARTSTTGARGRDYSYRGNVTYAAIAGASWSTAPPSRTISTQRSASYDGRHSAAASQGSDSARGRGGAAGFVSTISKAAWNT